MEASNATTTRVHEWVVENFPLAREQQIGLHDSLLDAGIIDSLGTLEIVNFLEQQFDIQISDEEMVADHFDSVHSIASFIESKNGSAETAGESELS